MKGYAFPNQAWLTIKSKCPECGSENKLHMTFPFKDRELTCSCGCKIFIRTGKYMIEYGVDKAFKLA